MGNTLLIEVTNQKALGLLHQLEELNLIKVLERVVPGTPKKLSDKYRGVITKEQGQDLEKHIENMRQEWSFPLTLSPTSTQIYYRQPLPTPKSTCR